jgi:hypothetical protein
MLRALVIVVASLVALPVQAATIGTFVRDYGSGPGQYDPGTPDTLGAGFVQIDDNPTGETSGAFVDTFDLSSLAGAVIETITLSLTYTNINTRTNGAGNLVGSELWYFDIYGSDPTNYVDNTWTSLTSPSNGATSTVSLTISAASDISPIDAFATTLSNMALRFGFEEVSGGNDNFRLLEAVVTVNGTAAVPLPATGLFLILALGALGWRRRVQLKLAAAA